MGGGRVWQGSGGKFSVCLLELGVGEGEGYLVVGLRG